MGALPLCQVQQLVGQGQNEVMVGELGAPGRGDGLDAIVGPGQLAVDGGRGVGVIAQVGGQQGALGEGPGMMEGPQGRLQALDHVAGALDPGRLALAVADRQDGGDARDEFAVGLEAGQFTPGGGAQGLAGPALQGGQDQGGKGPAGVQALDGGMGGAGHVAGHHQRLGGILPVGQGHRADAHQGTIAGAVGVLGAAEGVAGLDIVPQGGAHRVTDVEAGPGAAAVALPPPAHIAVHLVAGVEAPAIDQALSQAQGHGGVVGPLARRQAEGAPTHHVGQRLEAAGRLELEGGAQGIAGGEAEHEALVA